MKKWIALIVLGCLVVGVAVGTWWTRERDFESLHPKRGPMIEAIYGLGKVKTDRTYDVKLGLTSSVREIWVREGDSVKKGQPLVAFDATVFRAPFDGTVTKVNAHVGEVALAQTVALRMDDLSDRYVELSLEQEGALRVKKGQKARISFETLRGESLSGSVTSLFSRDDEFIARVQVEHWPESVLPGMTADVSVEVATIADALLIPVRAVSNGMVLVAKSGQKPQKLKVEIGHVDGLWAEVKGEPFTEADEVLVTKVR